MTRDTTLPGRTLAGFERTAAATEAAGMVCVVWEGGARREVCGDGVCGEIDLLRESEERSEGLSFSLLFFSLIVVLRADDEDDGGDLRDGLSAGARKVPRREEQGVCAHHDAHSSSCLLPSPVLLLLLIPVLILIPFQGRDTDQRRARQDQVRARVYV